MLLAAKPAFGAADLPQVSFDAVRLDPRSFSESTFHVTLEGLQRWQAIMSKKPTERDGKDLEHVDFIARGAAFMAKLEPRARKELLRSASMVKLGQGEYLFRQGDRGESPVSKPPLRLQSAPLCPQATHSTSSSWEVSM